MPKFSERYGYTTPSKVLIRESLPTSVLNAICTCFDYLREILRTRHNESIYIKLEENVWTCFLNQRLNDIYADFGRVTVITTFLTSNEVWYRKLDLLEYCIENLSNLLLTNKLEFIYKSFIEMLNAHFARLNYGYRIIDGKIVEVTSDIEIKTIEQTLSNSIEPIRNHISTALSLLSNKPEGDYRNSIKESISAVEVLCRQITGEDTLGKALKKLEKRGVTLPQFLINAFTHLYTYTNQPDTGIRHALIDDNGNIPEKDEAIFMLISCSAFINYVERKLSAYNKNV